MRRMYAVFITLLLFWWSSLLLAPEQPVVSAVTVLSLGATPATAPAVGSPSASMATAEFAMMPAAMAMIAQAYAAELATPAYARPLTNADTQLLEPLQFYPQQIPLEGGGHFSLSVSKYRYFYPESIEVTLVSTEQLAETWVYLQDETTGALLLEQPIRALQGQYQVDLAAQKHWDGALQVGFRFEVQGERQRVHTGIEYSQPVAAVVAVEQPKAEQADMVIPVELMVEQAGHYRLKANLFTATRQPIAHITAKAALGTGRQTMQLRVHKSVLTGQHGPYLLNTLLLERMSPSPGEPTRYGHSQVDEFELAEFAVDSLTDDAVPLTEQERQTLQLLQQLAQPAKGP